MSETTIFIGDSVTDCDRIDLPPFGDGYVKRIAESGKLSGSIINVGTSGHRLVDLVERWQRDVLDQTPTRLSVNIGINDTWRRYDDNDPTSADEFEANYRLVLDQVLAQGAVELVLCEPFLLPVAEEMTSWREDLDPKIEIVHRLASEYGATLVPFDQMFTDLAQTGAMAALAEDGIHPTPVGHQLMADLWLERVLG